MNKSPAISVVPEQDDSLVKKALTGDKSAFSQLVARYEKRVFAMVMEMVRHKQDAEDITQEVFVRAYFSLKNFRSESSFYTWLYRIAYNMTIDFKRRVARRPQDALAPANSDNEALNIEAVSDVQLPDQVIDNQERQQSIRTALSGISEEHRAVILLREVDGLSYDEISKVTGSARGTVMSRLHYARKHLQKVLRNLRSDGGSGDHGSGQGENDSASSVAKDNRLIEQGLETKKGNMLKVIGASKEAILESGRLAKKLGLLKLKLEPRGAKV